MTSDNPETIATKTGSEWADIVRELLVDIWLEQACRRPADRPGTRERLLAVHGPRVDEAVAELARRFATWPTDDPAAVVWRAFRQGVPAEAAIHHVRVEE